MKRFYLISVILHTLIFATIALSSHTSFKPLKRTEVYKVSLAPLPQPKVRGEPEAEVKPAPEEIPKPPQPKKPDEKRPPDRPVQKPETKPQPGEKPKTNEPSKPKGLADGLPDIRPQVYTGSGRGFNYSYYLNILLAKIGQNWQNPYRSKDVVLKTVVYFEIDETGTIGNVRIEESSGDGIYNESTIRAVVLTKKLPPLPQEFASDYLKVHLEFLTAQ